MSRTAPTLTATLAMSLISGAAIAGTSTYPECIASTQELNLNEIAERLFMQMPPEQQKQIALGDGIGSDSFDLEAFERGAEIEIPSTSSPTSPLTSTWTCWSPRNSAPA